MLKRADFIAGLLCSDACECIEWPYAVRKSNGYGAYSYRKRGNQYHVDAHRFVCEAAHGAPADGDQAAHKCGNKLCVNPSHLYWADAFTNMADAKKHGTLRGGGRYRQRFFEEQIADIRSSTESLLALAAKYDSDVSYMGRIRRMGNI